MKNRETAVPKEIFRAYDIRGIVDHSLTAEIVYAIGQALGSIILERGEKQSLIGRDGRLSGSELLMALSNGIAATGCDVVNIGMVPTPLLYFATVHWQIPSGVILTGSHNPSNYNGLKIMVGGLTLYEEGIQALYQRILKGDFKKGQGNITTQSIDEHYIKTLQNDIKLGSRLKVVIDAGNGVTGYIAPRLFESLNCEIIPLYCEVDGHFPNHHPDPGQPDNLEKLIEAVHVHKADIGLAFDGDGDRLGVVDNKGQIIWPDRQLILFARDVLARRPAAQIIYDVKCTRHLASDIRARGGEPLMWKTGHSLIKAKIKETGALLAGEMSGHFFFKDRWFGFDDALYAGARLLEIIANNTKKQTVSELFETIPNSVNTPELTVPIAESLKQTCIHQLIQAASLKTEGFQDATISTMDGLRIDWADGFGLVRASNTGPNLVLRFEGETRLALERIQNQFRTLFEITKQSWALPF
jgi:phosphomannomutase/phosphoglucomutase